jgi:hypothetical protein
MGSPRFGPAQPIVDALKPPDWLMKMLGLGQPAPAPAAPDTSWHDQMVKQANESARKAAADEQAAPRRKLPQGK